MVVLSIKYFMPGKPAAKHTSRSTSRDCGVEVTRPLRVTMTRDVFGTEDSGSLGAATASGTSSSESTRSTGPSGTVASVRKRCCWPLEFSEGVHGARVRFSPRPRTPFAPPFRGTAAGAWPEGARAS